MSEMQIVYETSKVAEAESIACLSRDHSLEVVSGASKTPDGEIISTTKDSCCENDGNVANGRSADAELRYACEPIINHEICSTSDCQQSFISRSLQKSRSRRAGERGKRKRWRGRNDELNYLSGMYCDGSRKSELCTTTSSASTDILKQKEVLVISYNMLICILFMFFDDSMFFCRTQKQKPC